MPKSSASKQGNPFHSEGGNFPAKTGNKSGGNRGNNPPKNSSPTKTSSNNRNVSKGK